MTISQLVSSASTFDGVLVRVIGTCNIAFEGTVLSRPEDGSNVIGASPSELQRSQVRRQHSIWLDLGWPVPSTTLALDGKPCLIEGRFDLALKGNRAVYQGTIHDITRKEALSVEAEAEIERRLSAVHR